MDRDDTTSHDDISAGEQIRIGSDSESAAYPSVLYTVPGQGPIDPEACDCDRAREQLGVNGETELVVRTYAPHPAFRTREEAREHDEFVEYLKDDGEQSSLVVTAPHGGRIEYRTDDQAALVAERLGVTEWGCAGYHSGGGAYDRWHITSVDISRRSFPLLDSIADREFDHAVSFHGFLKEGIAVGGRASRELKGRFCDEIEDATGGTYDVYIPQAGRSYAGLSRDNYVNWLTANWNGVQIEQCPDARVDDYEAIAHAVADVYEELIE